MSHHFRQTGVLDRCNEQVYYRCTNTPEERWPLDQQHLYSTGELYRFAGQVYWTCVLDSKLDRSCWTRTIDLTDLVIWYKVSDERILPSVLLVSKCKLETSWPGLTWPTLITRRQLISCSGGWPWPLTTGSHIRCAVMRCFFFKNLSRENFTISTNLFKLIIYPQWLGEHETMTLTVDTNTENHEIIGQL